jgi:hypothetical protein
LGCTKNYPGRRPAAEAASKGYEVEAVHPSSGTLLDEEEESFEQARESAVLVEGKNSAGDNGMHGIVNAQNLFRCGSDNAHRNVDIKPESLQARAALALASYGHAKAER